MRNFKVFKLLSLGGQGELGRGRGTVGSCGKQGAADLGILPCLKEGKSQLLI